MNSSRYLESYGWKEGEALRKGGIKKPILVKHKNDKKGIGHQPHGGVDAWWERLFDGQLKALDVNVKGDGMSFKQAEYVATGVAISESPLYRMFVRGETLGGTQGKVELTEFSRDGNGLATADITMLKTGFDADGSKKVESDDTDNVDKSRKIKKEKNKHKNDKYDKKKSKSEKKDKKEKKEKPQSLEISEKENKRAKKLDEKDSSSIKKEKKDKKEKKEKKLPHKRENSIEHESPSSLKKTKKRKSSEEASPKKAKKPKS